MRRSHRELYLLACGWVLALFLATDALSSSEGLLYREINLIGGYSDVNEWTGVFGNGQRNSVGFESYQKFSNEYGDFLTSDLQMRFSYNDLVDSDDAWALEIHNAWFDFKRGFSDKVRLGHFDPAFGLEPEVDTHSTLFQTLAVRDVGFKKDWGVGYSGSMPNWSYDATGTLGSGMGIERRDGSYLAAGKIGSSRRRNLRYGVSFLYGEVLQALELKTIPAPEYADDLVTRRRVGLDAQWLTGPFNIAFEVTAGRNDDNDVAGVLVQSDYNMSVIENVTLISQLSYWSEDKGIVTDVYSRAGCGFEWVLSSSVKVRAAYMYDFEAADEVEDRQALLQFYYLGK